jgi:hypothetical protein
MKLKGAMFWNSVLTLKGNRKQYSTASTVLLKHGRITVYVPKETDLKEIEAKIKLTQHFIFYLIKGTSYVYSILFYFKSIEMFLETVILLMVRSSTKNSSLYFL